VIQLWKNDDCLSDERKDKTLESLLNLQVGFEMRKPNS